MSFSRSDRANLKYSVALIAALAVAATEPVFAHNVSEDNARYVAGLSGPAVIPFIYLGAKHMVSGFDHLLYLVGILFFVAKPKDIVLYVSLFALGHSASLLLGVLADLRVNANIIDGIIGLSIVYKAVENLGGFRALFGTTPDPRVAVLVFGLCHGLGLATKLQGIALSDDGLIINLLSFNVGVEIGQLVALSFILLWLMPWRYAPAFERQAYAANAGLMTAGFLFTGYHLAGYVYG